MRYESSVNEAWLESTYDRVARVGGIISAARGTVFPTGWPMQVRDWLLRREPGMQPDEISYTKVLGALEALGYLTEGS